MSEADRLFTGPPALGVRDGTTVSSLIIGGARRRAERVCEWISVVWWLGGGVPCFRGPCRPCPPSPELPGPRKHARAAACFLRPPRPRPPPRPAPPRKHRTPPPPQTPAPARPPR